LMSQPNLLAGKKQATYVKVSLTGFKPTEGKSRAPVNVALVIDESGSMDGPKIEKAKEAAINAVKRLGPKDVVSVVSYDTTVNVLVPATRVGDKKSVIQRIMQLDAGGDTALYAGVSKGAAEVKKFLDKNRVNRVVLISDGQANVGPSSAGELKALGRMLIKDGISVSTIGLGMGYNEDVMMQLATASDGNHSFAVNAEALTEVFTREFNDILSVVAQNIEITIECSAGVTPVKVLGREAEIIGQTVTSQVNQLYGDQEQYLLLEVEVPAGVLGNKLTVASVNVSYSNMETKVIDKLARSVEVIYTGSSKENERSLNKKVMVSVISQTANSLNMDALDLRDQGKVMEASQLLQKNAMYLQFNADQLGSPALENQSMENYRQSSLLEKKDWAGNRKKMRVMQHQTKMQQADTNEYAARRIAGKKSKKELEGKLKEKEELEAKAADSKRADKKARSASGVDASSSLPKESKK
jgi:Ca-activated chloride channel family protein